MTIVKVNDLGVNRMKMFRVVIKVEDGHAVTERIRAVTWKSALVKHSILKGTAILELANLWLMDYKETVDCYKQFDIDIEIFEV